MKAKHYIYELKGNLNDNIGKIDLPGPQIQAFPLKRQIKYIRSQDEL